MLILHSGRYPKLTVFPETELDERAILTLKSGRKAERALAHNRQRVNFVLEKNTTYSLSLGGAKAGLIYLFDEATLLETGVHFWEKNGEKRQSGGHHFMPYQGYLGALCGLCHYQGLYHMFYEWNPFEEKGDTLYWGHAVSSDMLFWRHLPPLWEPTEELQLARYRTGGVRAGFAEVRHGGVWLYFTRSLAARGGEVLREYPMWAQSRDMVHFSEEMPLSLQLPVPHAGPSFGGPHLWETDSARYMVLGSTWKGRAALLLYREKGTEWEFMRPLLKEKEAPVWEYPDFFRLGRSYAAIGTFLGEERKTFWYLGGFTDGTFRTRARGQVDFGGDFSAPQTFTGDGRRLMIGHIDRKEKGNCLSLPREVFSRGGRLCQKPAQEVYSLRADAIYAGQGENKTLRIESDAFMAELQLLENTAFSLRLGGEENPVFLHYQNGRCFWETEDGQSDAAEIEKLYRVELFVDAHAAEVFLNDGEATGTKALCGQSQMLCASFGVPDKVQAFSVWRMNPPQTHEPEEGIPEGETFEF